MEMAGPVAPGDTTGCVWNRYTRSMNGLRTTAWSFTQKLSALLTLKLPPPMSKLIDPAGRETFTSGVCGGPELKPGGSGAIDRFPATEIDGAVRLMAGPLM